LLAQPLNGDARDDSARIVNALRQGHAFVAYDLPAPTRGFRMRAHGRNDIVGMGEALPAAGGVTIQIRLPQRAECLLIKDGKTIETWQNRDTCTHITTEAGVYRVEVYIQHRGKRRGWIFSNPIYLYK
jgi:hypothetical protein